MRGECAVDERRDRRGSALRFVARDARRGRVVCEEDGVQSAPAETSGAELEIMGGEGRGRGA